MSLDRHSGIIFDLDMTLVDTSPLSSLREKRLWNRVYEKIPTSTIFQGIINLIQSLKEFYSLGIVTSSPGIYARKLIEYHNLTIPLLIAYHDTKNHKPHPEPILKGCEQLGLPPSKVISVGDDFKDIEASNLAGCTSIFASWGSTSDFCLSADYNFSSVAQLEQLLIKQK
jgi:HAD superfamily hydrolase (TIGR01549 family)